jgi:hypothetical protein
MTEVEVDQAVRLLGHLFHRHFCPAKEIAKDRKAYVPPAPVIEWCADNFVLLDGPTECEAAGVPAAAWDGLKSLIANRAYEPVLRNWGAITLGDRPPPRHAIGKLSLSLVLHYADGTICPMSCFLAPEGPEPVTDGNLCDVVSVNTGLIRDTIVQQGVDGTHDKAEAELCFVSDDPADADPYEVAMGLILKQIPSLKPSLRRPVRNYMLLFQSLVRPLGADKGGVPLADVVRVDSQPKPAAGGWDG